jgi:hypothetical protein
LVAAHPVWIGCKTGATYYANLNLLVGAIVGVPSNALPVACHVTAPGDGDDSKAQGLGSGSDRTRYGSKGLDLGMFFIFEN